MGPQLPISQEMHALKYRGKGETFGEAMVRNADAQADNEEHFRALKDIYENQRFMGGGRVQAAMGSPREVTAFNCFVSMTIPDSMAGIMRAVGEAAETMRRGGGIGYDFSPIRPRNSLITTLESSASGPVSFMGIFNAMCQTISSAGHRRGAMMAVLRVDHPDIEEFVDAKTNSDKLTAFNISVGVTDAFMRAVVMDNSFDLVFDGRKYKTIRARNLWDKIMRNTWDWAEPGILFIDQINRMNNLWYCETIAATNPCGEQPLPPYGACLLGSWNMVQYIKVKRDRSGYYLDSAKLLEDIPPVVRGMDNVIDRTIYPLPEQEEEAQNKRRMGLGVTGMANALEALGYRYGSPEYIKYQDSLLTLIRDWTYLASSDLAFEKGSFPMFDCDKYLEGGFIKTLPDYIRDAIKKQGIRNSHLLSIAPTGTISLCADNVSSGIEPTFSKSYDRTIQYEDGPVVETITDYGVRVFGNNPVCADQVSAKDHVAVLTNASQYVDSAVSKTCNVGADVPWEDFKDLYIQAWEGNAKGCTTFRAAGKRYGILNVKEETDEPEACFIDPQTGNKSCDQ